MQQEVNVAGFGGQGVLFAGKLLAYAGMEVGKKVTWIPSYGPEMRGGTANCTVVISDEEIGSAFVKNPTAVLAMNKPSLDKFEKLVAPGGVLVVNSSMVDRPVERTDITVVSLPANEIAEEIGSTRSVNMVMVGALLANLDLFPMEAVEKALDAHTSARHKHLLKGNIEALHKGAEHKVAEMA